MATNKSKVIEITFMEIGSWGTTVLFDYYPERVWRLTIGAVIDKNDSKKVLFPGKYGLGEVLEEIDRWPFIRKYTLYYDNAYISIPHHMKYEFNDFPYMSKLLKGCSVLKEGICHYTVIDLTKRNNTKNLKKLNRSLLRKLNRNRDSLQPG